MLKQKFVMFTKDNARVLKNPVNAVELRFMSNVLENPDLSAVYGIAPNNWLLKDGKVIPKSGFKRSAGHGPPHIEPCKEPVLELVKEEIKKSINWKLVAIIAISALIGMLIRSI